MYHLRDEIFIVLMEENMFCICKLLVDYLSTTMLDSWFVQHVLPSRFLSFIQNLFLFISTSDPSPLFSVIVQCCKLLCSVPNPPRTRHSTSVTLSTLWTKIPLCLNCLVSLVLSFVFQSAFCRPR